SLLGLASFTYFYVMNQATAVSFFKGVRALIIFVGLFISAIYGYQTTNSIFYQDTVSEDNVGSISHVKFKQVTSIKAFEEALADANAEGKTVMLDLYADWCAACKEFEKYTFSDQAVIDALSNTVWMQIDLTDNNPDNLAFQEYFSVLGLPTILFFDKSGQELSSARVTGFMKASTFEQHVTRIF
ncbi:thioredoxin family protein, partial [Paraglaciecola sp.]